MQRRLFKTGVAKSKRGAHALIHALLNDSGREKQSNGRPVTHRTLGELIEEWMRVGGPQAVSTRAVYDGYLRAQILPFIGDIRLDRLCAADRTETSDCDAEAGRREAVVRGDCGGG